MYTATRFSGNFPNFFEMLCRDPFSQNLQEISVVIRTSLESSLQDNVQIFSSFNESLVLHNICMLNRR